MSAVISSTSTGWIILSYVKRKERPRSGELYSVIITLHKMVQEDSSKSEDFYLYVEMPIFEFPVVYDEMVSVWVSFGVFEVSMLTMLRNTSYLFKSASEYQAPRLLKSRIRICFARIL